MKAKRSIAVWLICKDGQYAGKVLLQQRSETEIIDGIKKVQSNPYICQPTWNEKVEEGESPDDAIKRGATEELGTRFFENFDFQLTPFITESYKYKGENFISFNFIGLISNDQLKLVNLHSGAMPNFIRVSSSIMPLVCSKSLGVNPKSCIALFEDQYVILQKLFDLRSKLFFLT